MQRYLGLVVLAALIVATGCTRGRDTSNGTNQNSGSGQPPSDRNINIYDGNSNTPKPGSITTVSAGTPSPGSSLPTTASSPSVASPAVVNPATTAPEDKRPTPKPGG